MTAYTTADENSTEAETDEAELVREAYDLLDPSDDRWGRGLRVMRARAKLGRALEGDR